MCDAKNGNFSSSRRGIYHTARRKIYPNGSELMVCNRPVFREPGWEARGEDSAQKRGEAQSAEPEQPQQPKAADTERAARRAAAAVRDLALCNDFRWFVTLTLDPARIDRYDVKTITKRLNTWLDNQVRRCGLRYVLVPERHKDGAIHFHGFVNDVNGFVSSGTWSVPERKKPVKPRSAAQRREWAEREDCHEVYNWQNWTFGFSTALELYGDYHSAVAYVCKYVRKQTTEGKIGGRWYYSGGELRRPEVELLDLGVYDLIDQGAYKFEVPEAGLVFGIRRE